jgi:hypothetical protein
MDKHYEKLVKLYLRLKGYLVSNLIIHSDERGNLKSELDIIGVRFPNHIQEYRGVNVEDKLQSSNSKIEIIIADVKNYKNEKKLKYNKGLRKDRESIKQLINWLGVFRTVNDEIVEKFENSLNIHRIEHWEGFAEFQEDLEVGKFNFKFTFFAPSLPEWNGKGVKYIHGEEIIDFIWECLNDLNKIKSCSRLYDYTGWEEYIEYVLFFKKAEKKVTLKEFEEHFVQK